MELRHLRYFVAVAEAENVSRAAVKLHLSQPALSRQIRDLEDELGFALLHRTPKAVRLTAPGKIFLTEARAVLSRAEQAVQKARAVATGAQVEIHVGYAPSPTVRIIPPILRAFQAQFPNVRVRLHDLSTEEMITGIRQRKLEIAFMVRPNRGMLRQLHFEELVREPMCLAVRPAHPLARSRSVTIARAAQEPLIVFSRREYPEYLEYLEALFAPGKHKLTIAEEHDGSSSLIAALESGPGVAIVPQSFSCSAGPRLKLIPLEPPPEPIIVGAVWPSHSPAPVAEDFWNVAKKVIGGKPH